MPKTRLLATAPTKEELLKAIEEFYCGTKFKILDDGKLQRLSDSKIIGSVIITKKKGRYRFEQII